MIPSDFLVVFCLYFLSGLIFIIFNAKKFYEISNKKDITPQTMGALLGFLWPYYLIKILIKKFKQN
jgi:hypothetical protein